MEAVAESFSAFFLSEKQLTIVSISRQTPNIPIPKNSTMINLIYVGSRYCIRERIMHNTIVIGKTGAAIADRNNFSKCSSSSVCAGKYSKRLIANIVRLAIRNVKPAVCSGKIKYKIERKTEKANDDMRIHCLSEPLYQLLAFSKYFLIITLFSFGGRSIHAEFSVTSYNRIHFHCCIRKLCPNFRSYCRTQKSMQKNPSTPYNGYAFINDSYYYCNLLEPLT